MRNDVLGRTGFVGKSLGQSPVHDLDFPKRAHHDVAGFQVAMDHALAVGESDRLTYLPEGRQPARPLVGRIATPCEQRGQRVAMDELHGDERRAVAEPPDVVDRNDRRMLPSIRAGVLIASEVDTDAPNETVSSP